MPSSVHPNDILWLVERMEALETEVRSLMERLKPLTASEKDWYTPAEFAREVHRSAYTIRAWCRTGRLEARKRSVGRGGKSEWELHITTLEHYRNHGLSK